MAILFPPLEPIAEEGGREFKLGRFPNRRYEPRNGGSATVDSLAGPLQRPSASASYQPAPSGVRRMSTQTSAGVC